MGRPVDFVVLGVVLLMSLSTLPVAYLLKKTDFIKDYRITNTVIWLCLAASVVVPGYVLRRRYRHVDFIIHLFTMGCFGCVLSGLTALELDNRVPRLFADHFLKDEPFLNSTPSIMACYWEGTASYVLQFSAIALYTMQESYREVSLYWSGSVINMILVFTLGPMLGDSKPTWAVVTNAIYSLLPVCAAFKLIRDRPLQARSYMRVPSITRRPLDLFFLLYFIIALVVALFRGFTVLGADVPCMKDYLKTYEPPLKDPSAFPKAQMLVYQFYFVFYYLCAIQGLLCPGQLWMSDWSIIHAGASAQSQFGYIASAISSRTAKSLRAPLAGTAGAVFWGVNLALLVVPHLFALRCWRDADNCGRTYTTEIARPITQPATRDNVYRTPKKGE